MAIGILSNTHITGELGFRKQGFKTVTPNSSTGEIALDLSLEENNYKVAARTGSNYFTWSNISTSKGKSGTIYLTNGTSSTYAVELFTSTETQSPGGAGITINTTNGAITLITYFVNEDGKVYVNGVSNWLSYPTP